MKQPDLPSYAALPVLEQALLWRMRAHRHGRCSRHPVARRIEAVLAAFGRVDALVELAPFMNAIEFGALRVIAIRCVCVRDVSEDEEMILQALSLLQWHDHGLAFDLLSVLLDVSSAARAAACGLRLGLMLAASGWLLAPCLDWEPAGLAVEGWRLSPRVRH